MPRRPVQALNSGYQTERGIKWNDVVDALVGLYEVRRRQNADNVDTTTMRRLAIGRLCIIVRHFITYRRGCMTVDRVIVSLRGGNLHSNSRVAEHGCQQHADSNQKGQ